jgi:hypothetical protein
MLFTIDQWLIAKFEAFCNAFATLTGKNNYYLARIFICISLAACIVVDAYRGNYFWLSYEGIAFPIAVIFAFFEERQAESRMESSLANPLKIDWRFHRIYLSIITAIIFIDMIVSAIMGLKSTDTQILILPAMSGMCLFYYLMSCDIKPPAKSLIREWLDALAPTPALVPVPVKSK